MTHVETNDALVKYNWLWFAQGYIKSAIILLDEILRSNAPRFKTEELWLPSSNINYIGIPIFYIIRHSFELVMKTTDTFKDKKITFTHDKELLLKGLIDIYGIEDKTVTRFVEIVEKYYSKEFYSDNFDVVLPEEDSFNEHFRFPYEKPKNGNKNHVDPSVFSRIHMDLAYEIKMDMEEVSKILLKFYSKYREPLYSKQ